MFNPNNSKNGSTTEGRYSYVPVKQELESEELGRYVTYGLSVRDGEKEIDFVSDVSTNGDEVGELAKRCNAEQLEPIQLREVIDDFLGELSAV